MSVSLDTILSNGIKRPLSLLPPAQGFLTIGADLHFAKGLREVIEKNRPADTRDPRTSSAPPPSTAAVLALSPYPGSCIQDSTTSHPLPHPITASSVLYNPQCHREDGVLSCTQFNSIITVNPSITVRPLSLWGVLSFVLIVGCYQCNEGNSFSREGVKPHPGEL